MTLHSMTGFSRTEGTSGRFRWAWEMRSVNGKGLDIRLRLPQGLEALETTVRELTAKTLSRGNLQISLSVSASENKFEAVVNRGALDAVLALKNQLGDAISDAPLSLDTLLSVRGLIEFKEPEDSADEIEARNIEIMQGFNSALERLSEMRIKEGQSLFGILSTQIERIETLTKIIEQDPSRQPDQIAERLKTQVALLTSGSTSLDSDRLHSEVALLATKADLREEIDRLYSHVYAARDLLKNGGPVGRKLDFLAQEFNRESNTICSKSNSSAVTAAGIELKVVIDQFREQVQNLE